MVTQRQKIQGLYHHLSLLGTITSPLVLVCFLILLCTLKFQSPHILTHVIHQSNSPFIHQCSYTVLPDGCFVKILKVGFLLPYPNYVSRPCNRMLFQGSNYVRLVVHLTQLVAMSFYSFVRNLILCRHRKLPFTPQIIIIHIIIFYYLVLFKSNTRNNKH